MLVTTTLMPQSNSDSRLDPVDLVVFKKAYQYATFLLSRREYSALGLLKKLQGKKYETAICDCVMQQLQQSQILDENRFVQSFVRYHFKKGHALKSIIFKLKQEGIIKNQLELQTIVEDSFSENECMESGAQIGYKNTLERQIEKRALKSKEKAMRYLLSKGYSYEAAISMVKSISN